MPRAADIYMTHPSLPAISALPVRHVDVAIVGAGAAGISAARACIARGLNTLVLEARPHTGGRAITRRFAGHPVDLGAHWMHAGEVNPLVKLGRQRGEPLRPAPRGAHLMVDGRPAPRSDREAVARGFDRMDRAFVQAARHREDRSAAAVVPVLGRWREAVTATLTLVSGRPLGEVSVQDYPSEEFGDNYFVRGGYGAYLARLAIGLPVRLATPVTAIDWAGEGVRLDTPAGSLRAGAVIVTVPVPVLQAGGLRFAPVLPDATEDAINGFLPGSYEHVILNWPDLPMRGSDRLGKLASGGRSLGMMTWMDGAPFHYVELDHVTMAGLDGQAATVAHVRERLREQFGNRALSRLRILVATRWRQDPWSLASWAVVPPGRTRDRDTLRRVVGDCVWFAGEATSRAQWGTVGGAWSEGAAAAEAVAASLANRR